MFTRIVAKDELLSEVLKECHEIGASLFVNYKAHQAIIADCDGLVGFIKVSQTSAYQVTELVAA